MSNNSSSLPHYDEILKSEGKIKFYIPVKSKLEEKLEKVKNNTLGKSMPVFYNEKMILNRDLTILMIKIFSKLLGRKITYLDSMAATGVRAIRLIKETDTIQKMYINDLNPLAIKFSQKNMNLNAISPEIYEIFNEDAQFLFSRFRYLNYNNNDKEYTFSDVVDIDPFGSPSQYIPAAMKCIEIGGMLCLTATDTPVLFGIRKEACIRKYLTKPIKTEFMKEMGTRILIYYAAKIAHLYELYIEPVLSISSDHFVRVFLIIKKGIEGVNKNLKKIGRYTYCYECGFRDIETLNIKKSNYRLVKCPLCLSKLTISGNLWLGNLHSEIYQQNLLKELDKNESREKKSYNKIKKFMELSINENKFPPFFYSIPKTADDINSTFPSLSIICTKLNKMGFKATRTHFDPQGIKTDANIQDVKRVILDRSINK